MYWRKGSESTVRRKKEHASLHLGRRGSYRGIFYSRTGGEKQRKGRHSDVQISGGKEGVFALALEVGGYKRKKGNHLLIYEGGNGGAKVF